VSRGNHWGFGLAEVTVRAVATGRVHGVSFRASLRETALSMDVTGWVRNRIDGSVEATLQGEELSVERVLEWMKHGPRAARVDSLRFAKIVDAEEFHGFRIL
jgi:acylphosphatase